MTPGTLLIDIDASCPLVSLEVEVKARVSAGVRPQVVFDLDDTLFLVHPRKQAIFREMAASYAAHPGLSAALTRLSTGPIPYDVHEALGLVGIDDPTHRGAIHDAFFDRFFDGRYTRHDQVCPGAPAYVGRLHALGARVVYLSGRPEGMRTDTVEVLEGAGFPLHTETTAVLLKGGPDAALNDVDFKRVAAHRLAAEAPCVAVFDNEPGNLNAMHGAMPEARFFLMDTDHSPAPPALVMAADVVPDFRGRRERLAAMWKGTPSLRGGRLEVSVVAKA